MPKLSDEFLLVCDPPKIGERTYWDSKLSGFGVRVRSSGHRSWVLKYRNRGGEQRKWTIGNCSDIPAAKARKLALEQLAEIPRGADPATKKVSDRQAETVSELLDRYISEHVEEKNRPSTQKTVQRLVEAILKPAIGRHKILEIAPSHMARMHHAMRAAPRQANQALAIASKAFNLAERWGLRPANSNPCRGHLVERYREIERERFPSESELALLGQSLRQLELTGRILPAVSLAIRLLTLSGCRTSEILSLSWQDVDLVAGVLKIRGAKAGDREHTLGGQALALLSAQPKTLEWVCPAPNLKGPLSYWTLQKGWRRICSSAGLENFRVHDLRHGYGTFTAQEAGGRHFIVRDALGHKTLAMANRYVGRDHGPVREVANRVTERIAKSLNKASKKVDASA